jgi:exosome complex component RRP46
MSGMHFSSRAAALNAGSLALLNTATVAMRAVAIAVSLAYVDGELLLDPTAEEEERAQSRFVFGWAFGSGISTVGAEAPGASEMGVDGDKLDEAEIIWTESEGEFTKDQVSYRDARKFWQSSWAVRRGSPRRTFSRE